ncbi:hypothetical protein FACS1894201_00660 [Bacteroidia bacterium]|nr:hypothetical protein FACS1894201_00660 [Bacteroidia bacterium]
MEFSFHVAGGLSSLRYTTTTSVYNHGLGGLMGANIRHYLNKNWSLGTGLDMSLHNVNTSISNFSYNCLIKNPATSVSRIENTITLRHYEEHQQAIFLQIPAMLRYQTAEQFYGSVGFKLTIPLSSRFNTTDGTVTISKVVADNLIQADPGYYGTYPVDASGKNVLSGVALSFSVEAGMKWSLKNERVIYTGVYIDYGLNNILAKQNGDFIRISPDGVSTRSVLSSQHTPNYRFFKRASPLSAGIKIAFAFMKTAQKPQQPFRSPDIIVRSNIYTPTTEGPLKSATDLSYPNSNSSTVIEDVFTIDTKYSSTLRDTIRFMVESIVKPYNTTAVSRDTALSVFATLFDPTPPPTKLPPSTGDTINEAPFKKIVIKPFVAPVYDTNEVVSPVIAEIRRRRSMDKTGAAKVKEALQNPEVRQLMETLKQERRQNATDIVQAQQPISNYGVAQIEPSEANKTELDITIALLKRDTDATIIIEGHTCNLGTRENNFKVGLRRAEAAKNYMVASGIAPDRIQTISKGDTEPLVPNEFVANKNGERDQHRAEAAMAYLAMQGYDPNFIQSLDKSEPNKIQDNRSRNRRIEIRIINRN